MNYSEEATNLGGRNSDKKKIWRMYPCIRTHSHSLVTNVPNGAFDYELVMAELFCSISTIHANKTVAENYLCYFIRAVIFFLMQHSHLSVEVSE